MVKHLADLPQISISKDDVLSGRLAVIQARAALEHGPVFWCAVEDHFRVREYVCLVGPEANRFVFHTGRELFSHDGGWTPIIGDALGKGLLNTDPPEHTQYRKLWNPAFTAPAMDAYLPVLEHIIAERSRTWLKQDTVDVLDEAREITFSAAAFALAGLVSGAQVEALRKLFYQQDHADHTQRDRLLLELIAQRRARPDGGSPRDVLGQIVFARDDNGTALSDQQIVAHTNNLLVAGHETTTTLSAWTLYLLATLPEQRQRIEAELDALLGDPAQPLAVEQLRKLHHLENVIKEVGRLYPPVLTVPRSVASTVELGGYVLPAGTPVRLALGASHLLPQVFTAPLRFDPDRFAAPRQEDRRTPYGLVTFGGGQRMCIGIHFAQLEIKALAAHVLRRYHLEPAEDSPPPNAGHLTALLERGIRLRVRSKRHP